MRDWYRLIRFAFRYKRRRAFAALAFGFLLGFLPWAVPWLIWMAQ